MNISILLLLQVAGADTVPLSLADALRRTREANPAVRAERAAARAGGELPREASRGLLPSLRLDAGAVRTTDPVAAFGLKLRQENFQASDLALDALNRPAAYGGYSASATLQQPLFAPEGLFGYLAARRAASATSAAARRAIGATLFRVTRDYWDALLAERELAAWDTTLIAARAHADEAEALRRQGLVTGLDGRLARIRVAELESRRLAAQATAQNALSALRAELGMEEAIALRLTDSLADDRPGACDGDGQACGPGQRADLAALRDGAAAAEQGVRRAWAAQLPAVVAFGNLSHYARTASLSGGSGDWTVGIGVAWRPFEALSGIGAVRRAKAEREVSLARLEGARRQAELEVVQAGRLLQAALARVAVASQAETEARAALDQARVRYRTGTSAIGELLDVQATAANTTMSLLGARRDLLVARAASDFANGAYDQ